MKDANTNSLRSGYQKGEERLKVILRSAEEVLIEHGYHNFSLRKVATKAGISVGNLQYYFPSRDELIDAMMQDVVGEYLIVFEQIRDHDTPREQLVHIIEEVVLDLNSKRTTLFFPELWSMSNHEAGVNRYMESMYAKYQAVLKDVIMDINPALTDKQAERLSLFIAASIEGHTIFIGYKKPWTQETKPILSISIQSFLWLIEHGDIPK